MKKLAIFLLATLLGAPLMLGQQASQDQSTVVEEIIARVNNSIVTHADLRRSRDQLQTELRQENPSSPTPVDQKEREKDLLRDLIDQQLLLQKGEELGINVDTDVV